MRLADVVAVSDAVRATSSRREKVAALADLLRDAEPRELPVAASLLAGHPRQGKVSVGWRTLRTVEVEPAPHPRLGLVEVDRVLGEIASASGPGSTGRRAELLAGLFGAATDAEQAFLRGLVLGELRQGALEGMVAQALARAWELREADVRRALMLAGDLGVVAQAAATGGEAAVRAFELELFRPVQPMLAKTSDDVVTALEEVGGAAVEAKLDGVRLQVHRDGHRVGVWSRTLKQLTTGAGRIVDLVRELPATSLVLDGEVLALDPDGRPRPLQDTMRALGDEDTALAVFFFDLLHRDGRSLLDVPLVRRRAELCDVVPDPHRVTHTPVRSGDDAEAAYHAALDAGHEGVVVKALDSPYEAGRRGRAWRKVKPAHSLDLVVLAVEWGSGRRTGWLSNLHLGAPDPDGGFVMLGKTFKGLTDERLAWQTQRFLGLETHREPGVVHVRPEQVVEVAIDGLVRSPRYPAGLALRFARVLRYRDDKSPDEADTIETVRGLATP
ncbi:ATP-dependent DNA ligase [Egibacter rhizosphaerae]|uniref:DNA ligase B n=1 Tax=Egibacter rhizosphaerae TaxID=1670831 RepID=A0A411YIG7_9ACTN|nr:ATP-dependent DNA ligase [Egibacter rhizosphaerae]QBI20941.1 ATP-dependent DNA ligase [Egibacter rhizosphaerae]